MKAQIGTIGLDTALADPVMLRQLNGRSGHTDGGKVQRLLVFNATGCELTQDEAIFRFGGGKGTSRPRSKNTKGWSGGFFRAPCGKPDYRPALQGAGLEIETYEETPRWADRQCALLRAMAAAEPQLRAEMDDASANEFVLWARGRPTELADTRRIFGVARKPT